MSLAVSMLKSGFSGVAAAAKIPASFPIAFSLYVRPP
jgi:hypothetical protein